MSNQDSVEQISRLSRLLEKLTNQFEKYFRKKSWSISENSQSDKVKKEPHRYPSQQVLDSLEEEKPKNRSPRQTKPRPKQQDLDIRDVEDDMEKPEPAGGKFSKTFNEKSKESYRRRDAENDNVPAQQQLPAIHIHNSNHNDSSNHHNNVPPVIQHTAPVPAYPVPHPQPAQTYPLPSPQPGPTYPLPHPQPGPSTTNPRDNPFHHSKNVGNGTNFQQIYPMNNFNMCSGFLLFFGIIQLLGGIAMVIVGSIQLSNYSATTYSSSNCPSPYTYSGGQCCYYYTYNYNYNYNYNYCYWPSTKGSPVLGIVLLCVGSFAGIVGISLLVKSYRVYQNNNHPIFCQECC